MIFVALGSFESTILITSFDFDFEKAISRLSAMLYADPPAASADNSSSNASIN